MEEGLTFLEQFRNVSGLGGLGVELFEGKGNLGNWGTQILGAVAAVWAVSLVIRWGKQKGFGGKEGLLTIEDIPCHSYHFMGMKLPLFLEGIITPIQMRLYGIRAVDRWVKESGPIFRLGMLYKRLIFVTDLPLVQKILQSSDPRILDKPRFLYSLFFQKWMKDGLIASNFKIWEGHRKMLVKGFTYNTLANYLNLMNEHSKEMLEELNSMEKANPQGKIRGPRLHDLLQESAISIIADVLVSGGGVGVDAEDIPKFYKMFKRMKELIVGMFLYPYNLIGPIWALNPKSRELKTLFQESEGYFLKYINRSKREMELERKESKNNLTFKKPYRGLIMEMLRGGCSNYDIFGEMASFLVAGQESTTSTLNFFLQFMAENPEIQKAVQEEVDCLFLEKDGEKLTQEDVQNLKFMDRCVLETSRWMASIPMIFRELSQGMQIGSYYFPKGSTICIPIWAVHRNPEQFPNPEKFNPDRFLPEEVAKRHPQSFLTFSHGPRNCIGMKVAVTELKVMIAYILRNFDVTTEDKVENMKILFDVTLATERDFHITLKRRQF